MKNWYRSGSSLIHDLSALCPPQSAVSIWHIGQCGIILKYGQAVLFVDPVLTPITDAAGISRKHLEAPFRPEDPFDVNAVFCTHNHLDHLNPDTVRGIASAHPQTRFFIPAGVLEETADLFAGFSDRVVPLRQGDTVPVADGICVTAVAAAHDQYRADANGNEKALGYLFRCGPLNLFHAGDTLATPRLVSELRALGPIHAAFLPINGRDWARESDGIIGNMNPQEAALFAEQIRCDTVFPTHYDMMIGNEENPLIFAQYMADRYPYRPFHFLQPGEPFLFWRSE